jgi:hypothetical protein
MIVRNRHHLGVNIRIALRESGRSHFLRRPQGDQHHARAARLDHDRPLAPA